MRNRLLSTSLALATAAAALPAGAQSKQSNLAAMHSTTFSQTVFFGDSLSDAGFYRPLLPLNAQPVIGQFTTNPGMVWSQFLASYYGSPIDPAWTLTTAGVKPGTGTNYAAGGARVSQAPGYPATPPTAAAPSLSTQIGAYLAANGGRADPNALYTVWGGANDLFTYVSGATTMTQLMQAPADQIGLVKQLQAAGARYVLVPNIPDLGSTPAYRVQGAAAMAGGTQLSMLYNDALFKGLAGQGIRVIPLNTFTLLREIIANPAPYGFTNVTSTACLPAYTATSLTCNPTSYASPDAASTYAFADGVHPSTAAHKVLADYAVATIEGPRQVAVLPFSASLTGRNRSDMLSSQLASMTGGDGMRWWFNLHADNQRHARGSAGDGFDGIGPSLGGGIGWNSGALRYGAALNAGRQRVDYGARRGDFRQNEIDLTGFAGWHGERGWVNAQLGYARVNFDVNRQVWLGQAMRTHAGSAKGSNLHGSVDGGWMFGDGMLRHGPVAKVLLQHIRLDGYTESEPALATALAFPNQSFDSRIASLGYEARFQVNEKLTPYVRASAEREFGKLPAQASASMPSLSTALPYNVPGVSFDRSYGVLAAGLKTNLAGFEVRTDMSRSIAREGGTFTGFSLTVGKTF